MESRIKIAPSILAADFARLGEEIMAITEHGADQVHIDVMDGRFVPNISFGHHILQVAQRFTDLPLDVHLMIVEPERHLETYAKAGAAQISVHVEACPNLHRVLQEIRALDVKAGVAINPHTPAVMVSEILPLVDNLIVMTVNPGAGGQAYLHSINSKIQELRRMVTKHRRQIDITVDGGIDTSTVGAALRAGANVLVAGTSVFKTEGGVSEGIKRLRETALKVRSV